MHSASHVSTENEEGTGRRTVNIPTDHSIDLTAPAERQSVMASYHAYRGRIIVRRVLVN